MVAFSTLAVFAGIATTVTAAASNIKNLVVFGDSNSGKSMGETSTTFVLSNHGRR